MSCCGTEILPICAPRNQDLRITYAPRGKFSFATFTGWMQVRLSEGASGPPLLNLTMVATANGSVFEAAGDALVLTITKADLATLPTATPISDPISFVYDVIVTDATGFKTNLVGGPFTMLEGVTR